jgi:hypothetical protein
MFWAQARRPLEDAQGHHPRHVMNAAMNASKVELSQAACRVSAPLPTRRYLTGKRSAAAV